jgi:monofunctional biosynthetic peptidoglycan transglycosylase
MDRVPPARRWLGRVLLVALAAAALPQIWFFGWVVYWKWHDPVRTSFMTIDQQRLDKRRPPARLQHQWVDYGRISVQLKRAVITAEDARFTEHEGVDWTAVEKAYKENRRRGRPARGGSTISQQLAKNLFLSPERSYARKLQELLIAWMIEAAWDKRRILEVYLNVVEWGDGIYGAEAAAHHYFDEPAAALTPDQAAQMAAMLPAPKYFDHHRDAPFLTWRTDSILRYLDFAQIPQ